MDCLFEYLNIFEPLYSPLDFQVHDMPDFVFNSIALKYLVKGPEWMFDFYLLFEFILGRHEDFEFLL